MSYLIKTVNIDSDDLEVFYAESAGDLMDFMGATGMDDTQKFNEHYTTVAGQPMTPVYVWIDPYTAEIYNKQVVKWALTREEAENRRSWARDDI
jgi:hypothetical protein